MPPRVLASGPEPCGGNFPTFVFNADTKAFVSRVFIFRHQGFRIQSNSYVRSLTKLLEYVSRRNLQMSYNIFLKRSLVNAYQLGRRSLSASPKESLASRGLVTSFFEKVRLQHNSLHPQPSSERHIHQGFFTHFILFLFRVIRLMSSIPTVMYSHLQSYWTVCLKVVF